MSVFQDTLGDIFNRLPRSVRELHRVDGQGNFEGRATVTAGSSLLAQAVSRIFGFPKTGGDVPVHIHIECCDDCEVWVRDFDGHSFRSEIRSAGRGRIFERLGLFEFEIDLSVRDHRLYWPVSSATFIGLHIPKFVLPISETCEFEREGQFCFDVKLRLPITQEEIVHYQGWLKKC
ncbi:MAG: DUF4166 domain-containing protein [Pseudomonadota bacterium]